MPIDSANRRAIAARLADLRKRAGYVSQRAFARAVGVSGGLVAQWETGAKCPGRANLAKIARVTGVPVDWILGTTTVMEPVTDSQIQRTAEMVRLFEAAPVAFQKNLVQLLREAREGWAVLNHEHEPA